MPRGGDGVGGMAGWALFFGGIAGSAFFFGGMAGFELLAGCDITNLFWRDGGISVIFRRDGGIGTRSGMQYFLFLRGSLIISYLVYKDNSIQRFSGEELLSNVSPVCVSVRQSVTLFLQICNIHFSSPHSLRSCFVRIKFMRIISPLCWSKLLETNILGTSSHAGSV